MDERLKKIIIDKSRSYLLRNPERLNQEEKRLFETDLKKMLYSSDLKNLIVCGEIYDFFVDEGLIEDKQRRFISYKNYINSRYSAIRFKRLLDIGSGRMCKSSKLLAKYGFEMYAIDPKIRLTEEEAQQIGVAKIFKEEFECDEFSTTGTGTNVDLYDLLCGVEPCDATEAGIRQALAHDKYFDFCFAIV